jgi:hypothetical protein
MAENNQEVVMSKFKIGDKVRVNVKDVEVDSEVGDIVLVESMKDMDGGVYLVQSVTLQPERYFFDNWCFAPEWLELIKEAKPEKTTGLTLPEILRALADGKKVRCPSWGEWRFVYIDLTNGDMLDEDGLDFSDWDVLVGCSELYVEPEPKPEKVTEQRWLWYYQDKRGCYVLGDVFRTEQDAMEYAKKYGYEHFDKYGEPIEVKCTE